MPAQLYVNFMLQVALQYFSSPAPLVGEIMQSQWLFPISALQLTPSVVTSSYTVAKELYDRSRGVEFLFRLGSSLGLFV
jgi:hypothetical protein